MDEQELENCMRAAKRVACPTPKEGHTLDELKEKDPEISSMNDGDRKMQTEKEKEVNIEELDMVRKETDHLMDPIVNPHPEKANYIIRRKGKCSRGCKRRSSH